MSLVFEHFSENEEKDKCLIVIAIEAVGMVPDAKMTHRKGRKEKTLRALPRSRFNFHRYWCCRHFT
jgi:hypothetical protein